MFRKVLLYGFPIYLYVLERMVRALANVPIENSFAGPTLAGAGILFLIPLTALKRVPDVDVDPKVHAALMQMNVTIHSRRDESFCNFVWLMFLISLLAWIFSMYITFRTLPHMLPSTIPWSFVIGCLIFFISVVLAEIKERI